MIITHEDLESPQAIEACRQIEKLEDALWMEKVISSTELIVLNEAAPCDTRKLNA